MPIEVLKLDVIRVTLFNRRDCVICNKAFEFKLGDLIVKKSAGKIKLAHTDCALKKNWIERKDLNNPKESRTKRKKKIYKKRF